MKAVAPARQREFIATRNKFVVDSMSNVKNVCQFSVLFLIIDVGHAFNIIGINKQMLYEYVGNVLVGSKPQDEGRPAPPTTGWIVRGKLTLQRQNELFMAAAVSSPSPFFFTSPDPHADKTNEIKIIYTIQYGSLKLNSCSIRNKTQSN